MFLPQSVLKRINFLIESVEKTRIISNSYPAKELDYLYHLKSCVLAK